MLSSPRQRLAATACTGALALTAGLAQLAPAFADPVQVDDVTIDNQASWDFEAYETTNIFDTGPVTSIDDAQIGSLSDAWDGAFELKVGDQTFFGGEEADLTGRVLTTETVPVSGLRVTATYRALANTSTLQVLYTLRNPGKKTLARNLQLATNVGSDSDTVVVTTSSGNKVFDHRDRWLISKEDVETPSDPVDTQVYGGPGGLGLRDVDRTDVDEWISELDVKVPGRASRHLLLFLHIDETAAKARKAVKVFNDRNLNAKLLAGIPKSVRNKVLNWDL